MLIIFYPLKFLYFSILKGNALYNGEDYRVIFQIQILANIILQMISNNNNNIDDHI